MKEELNPIVEQILEGHTTWDFLKGKTKEVCSAVCHEALDLHHSGYKLVEKGVGFFQGEDSLYSMHSDAVKRGHEAIDEWFETDLADSYLREIAIFDEKGCVNKEALERMSMETAEMMACGSAFNGKFPRKQRITNVGKGKTAAGIAVKEIEINTGRL